MTNVVGYVLLITLIALGVSIYYNYYLSMSMSKERKKSKNLDRDNKKLKYTLQRTQNQVEMCMTEKRNGRQIIEQREVVLPQPDNARPATRKINTSMGGLRYVSPAYEAQSVMKRGIN